MSNEPVTFYLGEVVDPQTGERTGQRVDYKRTRLTTHGVIVGMTGSGKTGLGVVMLEEALASGVPTLVIDPKGDMANLALRFPDLSPAEFAPWVTADDAARAGQTPEAYAAAQAEAWRAGLADWGLGQDDIRHLSAAGDVTVYTPGSTAGLPLAVLGSLAPPAAEVPDEVVADEVEGFVSGLLEVAGIAADPLASREHILLSNIIHAAWNRDQTLSLADLIAQVQRPPLRKLGVFDLETFYPEAERLKLAMRLNGLLAAPAFATWLRGEPLDIPALLFGPDGRPRASVLSLGHLTEAERHFVVTLVLSKVVTWMNTQPGTSDLRALVYIDEVVGMAPPSAQPPTKKPILTLLKQGRAFGVGMLLCTQNPVDLDYKAISNSGTWLIGRLNTVQDRARLLDGLPARAGIDRAAMDQIVAGLAKRQFVLVDQADTAVVLQTRWAMSYLRGPLTRSELQRLAPAARRAAALADPAAPDGAGGRIAEAPAAVLAADETDSPPSVAAGIPVRYLDPATPWARGLPAAPSGTRLHAGLAVRVSLVFDERTAGVDHREEWEAVYPIQAGFDVEQRLDVDHDPRDFGEATPAGAVYAVPKAPIGQASFFRDVERALVDSLYRDLDIEVQRNAALKLYSRVGETREDFLARCHAAAADAADVEAAKLRQRFETRLRKLEAQRDAAARRGEELASEMEGRKREELLGTAGDLLSAFLGGRGRTRSLARGITSASRRRRMTSGAAERVQTADERAGALGNELAAIEAELTAELAAIDQSWTERAEAVEPLKIGLERSDVRVSELVLFWFPVAG